MTSTGTTQPSSASSTSIALQTAVITLAALRRLRFGGDARGDRAARAYLAALGLVALGEEAVEVEAFDHARAAPYSGRLAELERLHRRHVELGDANARPKREPLPTLVEAVRDTLASVFGRDWIVLEAADRERPDLRAAAVVARLMRAALMDKFGNPVPEWLSGHEANGEPSRDPHLAIVPLADIGWPCSDGGLKGLALIAPRALEEEWRAAATPRAFAEASALGRALARMRDSEGVIELAERAGQKQRIVWGLRETTDPDLESSRAGRYCRESAIWSTATPIALDRFTRAEGHARLAEAAAIVAQACENIRLPRPASVQVHKHSAIQGSLAAWRRAALDRLGAA